MRVLAARSFGIVAASAILASCSNSESPVASVVPPANAVTATARGTIGGNGTTLQIAGPFGTAATITLSAATAGVGSPVVATLSVPAATMASFARGRFDTTSGQPISVEIRVTGTVMWTHQSGVSPYEPNDVANVELRLPQNQGDRYSGNEDARVTDSEGFSTCAADLNASQTPQAPDHSGGMLQLDNGIDLTTPQGTNATIDANFVIDTANTSNSRRRSDAGGESCSAATSTQPASSSPEPSAEPSAMPTASAAPSSTPTPGPTQTPIPTATPSTMPTPSAMPTTSAAPSSTPSAGPTTNACPYAGTFSGPLTDGRSSPPLVTTFTQTVSCSGGTVNVSWSDPSYGTGGYSGTASGLTVTLAGGEVINQYSADYNSIVSTESDSMQQANLTRTGP